MRCFLRSTRSFAERRDGIVLAMLIAVGTVGISAEPDDDRAAMVDRAIVAAVKARMAPTPVTVTVDAVTDIRFEGDMAPVTAHIGPDVRAGVPARFVLTAPGRRGEATALVQVVADGVRATAGFERGAVVADGDVREEKVNLNGRPIRPFPLLADVIGGKATRDVLAGALVMRGDVTAVPVVRIGREVAAHVTVGDARVTGTLIAAQNGTHNQIIRVVNPETRQVRQARVIGVDEVEVLHGR